jgi:hypothetical protein
MSTFLTRGAVARTAIVPAAVPQKMLAASAATMAAIGLLTAPAPAQADPPCTQYGFNGRFSLKQSNDWDVNFNSDGATAYGNAWAKAKTGEGNSGGVTGGVEGRNLNFTIRWDGGPYTGKYRGTVDDNGFAHGVTEDWLNPELPSARWDSTVPLKCLDAPPPPAPGRQLGKSPIFATVIGGDVDVYNVKNEPEGAGQVVGILRVGDEVELVEKCAPESWCNVSGPKVPGGNGWIWGHLQLP